MDIVTEALPYFTSDIVDGVSTYHEGTKSILIILSF